MPDQEAQSLHHVPQTKDLDRTSAAAILTEYARIHPVVVAGSNPIGTIAVGGVSSIEKNATDPDTAPDFTAYFECRLPHVTQSIPKKAIVTAPFSPRTANMRQCQANFTRDADGWHVTAVPSQVSTRDLNGRVTQGLGKGNFDL